MHKNGIPYPRMFSENDQSQQSEPADPGNKVPRNSFFKPTTHKINFPFRVKFDFSVIFLYNILVR
jgi:hypothetical protein